MRNTWKVEGVANLESVDDCAWCSMSVTARGRRSYEPQTYSDPGWNEISLDSITEIEVELQWVVGTMYHFLIFSLHPSEFDDWAEAWAVDLYLDCQYDWEAVDEQEDW